MRDYQSEIYGPLSVTKVLLVQGYDPDGDYWGNPPEKEGLYRIFDEEGPFVQHVHSRSTEHVKRHWLQQYPDAVFTDLDDSAMLREISWMILADGATSEDAAIAEACRNEGKELTEAIVQRFGSLESLEPHLLALDRESKSYVEQINDFWKDSSLTFQDLYYENGAMGLAGCQSSAFRTILAMFGHGVSPWDDLDPDTFGVFVHTIPSVEPPYNIYYDVIREVLLPELFKIPAIPNQSTGSETSFDLAPWLEQYPGGDALQMILAVVGDDLNGEERWFLLESRILYELLSEFTEVEFSNFEVDLLLLKKWIAENE